MAGYPYVYSAANLKKYLNMIPDLGTPVKVTQEYLESIGFKSKNDRAIVSVMKTIDLLADDGTPTEDYKLLRSKAQFGGVMASHIRKGYAELFSQFPDADTRSTEQLKDFFATKTDAGSAALYQIVATFKTLCEAADFGAPTITLVESQIAPPGKVVPRSLATPQASEGNVTINLNIQLQLPTTENSEIYDKVFESVRKHFIEREPPTEA